MGLTKVVFDCSTQQNVCVELSASELADLKNERQETPVQKTTDFKAETAKVYVTADPLAQLVAKYLGLA